MGADKHIEAWLTTIANSNTSHTYGGHLRRFASWCDESGVPLLGLGYASINRYLKEELEVRGESLVKQRLHAIRHFYNFLVREGELQASPAHHPQILGLEDSWGRSMERTAAALDVDDLQALIAAAVARGPRHAAAVGLLAINALKPGDIEYARIEHRSLRHGRDGLEVPNREFGTWTPLTSPTIEALDAHAEGRRTGPLLRNFADNPAHRRNLSQWIRTAGSDAGIEVTLTAGLLRDSAGAIAQSRGVGMSGLRELLGRRSVRGLERYTALRPPAYSRVHPATVVARTLQSESRFQTALTVLEEGSGPPALAVMQASAALEEQLRRLARASDPTFDAEKDGKLTVYSGRLIHHAVISSTLGRQINAVAIDRDLACHGWFERFDHERAKQCIDRIRRILEELPAESNQTSLPSLPLDL